MIAGILVLAVAIGVYVTWRFLAEFKRQMIQSDCIANLRLIQHVKEQWAKDNEKTANEIVQWNDLVGSDKYIKNTPFCPTGAQYQINRVGEAATCPVGGSHSL